MAELDDFDKIEEDDDNPKEVNKKKILLFILPALIAIGLAVGLYHTFESSFNDVKGLPYNVLEQNNGEKKQSLVFYDLPEISATVKSSNGENSIANFKISIELTNIEDVKKIETLLPRFYDIILAHTQNLHAEEISGSEGLYWLKQELLYRINLAAAPIKIENINFKSFDIQKK